MPVVGSLPLTALACFEYGLTRILFAGSGCNLEVYDVRRGQLITHTTAFKSQAIHGIVIIDHKFLTHEFQCKTLVYGGKYVAYAYLSLTCEDESILSYSLAIIDTIQLPDWILCSRARIHSSSSALFITSYNVLIEVKLNEETEKLASCYLSEKLSTFLYSADVMQTDSTNIIVASGTAFGEVFVWVCRYNPKRMSWESLPWKEFHGHNGSIFGVSISTVFTSDDTQARLVATCSDDRTMRLWDVSNLENEVSPGSMGVLDEGGLIKTAFIRDDKSIATIWAHLSRIWHVDFAEPPLCTTTNNCLLLSTGEDGQAQCWIVDVNTLFRLNGSINQGLRSYRIDRHHAGKNIWSRCIQRDNLRTTLYTGGADGQIVLRHYPESNASDHESKYIVQSFSRIQLQLPLDQNFVTTPLKKPTALKSYSAIGCGKVLATTDSGSLLQGIKQGTEFYWYCLAQNAKKGSLVIASNTSAKYAFIANTLDSTLCVIDFTTSRLSTVCQLRSPKVSNVQVAWWCTLPNEHGLFASVSVSYYGASDFQLVWVMYSQGTFKVTCTSAQLPATFDITASFYDAASSVLLCGSRAGAVAIYYPVSERTTSTDPVVCRRHLHHEDTVTSIHALRDSTNSNPEDPAFYLTTGRDGHYCVVKLFRDEKYTDKVTCNLEVVHQITPPFGPYIEGAHLVQSVGESAKLFLHGFRSKDFVVWDETNQSQVMIVDCGGAHRSWSFHLDQQSNENSAFAWTKAGTFMYHEQKELNHFVIQPGGHGREIKAIAIHKADKLRWLIATGSEDTDIRLFDSDVSSSSASALHNIAVVRKHTTGIQNLHFSSSGRILISAAGMEEMFAWRLSSIPILKQGIVFTASLPRSDTQSDARIMSIDMQDTPSSQGTDSLLIVAAFSNGKLKTIKYDDNSEGEAMFTLLHQFDLGTICLTQAYLTPSIDSQISPNAIVAATNGHISQCNLLDSTDLPSDSTPVPTTPQVWHHAIHRNSITALSTVSLTSMHKLIVTGGDDNALAFTLATSPPQSSRSPSLPTGASPTYRSLIIPKAHAAAITAIAIIDLGYSSPSPPNVTAEVYTDHQTTKPKRERRHSAVLTISNDQRLQVWHVAVAIDKLPSTFSNADFPEKGLDLDLMSFVEIEVGEECYTNVADSSSMSVLWVDFEKRQAQVLVVGVGLESLDLSLPDVALDLYEERRSNF